MLLTQLNLTTSSSAPNVVNGGHATDYAKQCSGPGVQIVTSKSKSTTHRGSANKMASPSNPPVQLDHREDPFCDVTLFYLPAPINELNKPLAVVAFTKVEPIIDVNFYTDDVKAALDKFNHPFA